MASWEIDEANRAWDETARGRVLPAAGRGRGPLMADGRSSSRPEGLTKEFRGFVAVKDVNLARPPRHASTR